MPLAAVGMVAKNQTDLEHRLLSRYKWLFKRFPSPTNGSSKVVSVSEKDGQIHYQWYY